MAFPSRSELWQWRIEEYLSRGTIGLAEAISLILLLDHSNDSNARPMAAADYLEILESL